MKSTAVNPGELAMLPVCKPGTRFVDMDAMMKALTAVAA